MKDPDDSVAYQQSMSAYIDQDWFDEEVTDFYWELNSYRWMMDKATRRQDRKPRF